MKILHIIVLLLAALQILYARQTSTAGISDTIVYLNIPERPANALTGSAFAAQVTGMSIEDREIAVVREILSGNVPSFSRTFRSLKINQTIDSKDYELVCFAACDYLAIGSDEDYLYMPLTPSTAQYLADQFNCSLPTSKIVDHIYTNAEIKLSPQPIPPSDTMTTIQVFGQHMDSINQQFSRLGSEQSASAIVAGHKKDIIISNRIYDPDGSYERVVIYGWHLSENNPIQPVFNGHIARYADYSHGVRFISKCTFINGSSIPLEDVLKNPVLSSLLSNEGAINKAYYPESKLFTEKSN